MAGWRTLEADPGSFFSGIGFSPELRCMRPSKEEMIPLKEIPLKRLPWKKER
jgi:hypothetical protein